MRLVDRLSRYKDLAWFVAKYARTEFAARDGEEGLDPTEKERQDAKAFAADLEALGPTFIKLGQFLSTRADLLPPPYLEALARLQDDLEPFPYADVERIVQDELCVRLSKAFVEFNPEPIAAASLGQVHRAVLRGGREVAVKVQRPGIRERVLKDLDALHELAPVFDRFAGPTRSVDTARMLQELRQSLVLELDYREEARSMTTIAAQLREFDSIIVPLPVEDLTTARVLTMDYVPGVKITAVSPVERTEIDGASLADQLFRAYLQQILVDGVFHADPHPGNVLLTPDHRLGLIDLGMVGRLSPTVQEHLVKLVLAIAEGRGDDAARVAIVLSEKQDDFNEPAMTRAVASDVSRYQGVALKQLNVGRVMLEIMRQGGTHGLRMAPDMALLGKALLNLDEIGRVLDPEFDVNASLRRNANSLMQRRMWKTATPANLWTSTIEVREFVQQLPGRVNRILDALAGDNLKLKVELIDHGSIIEGLQKVANRIALGLVLAALIVGAAMLMRVPTAFTILGYPGVAILLFMAAAGGGFWMAWNILFGDVHTNTRGR
jgi:predicted unusual protein kinase regulating ubiquinone biosynthesis (AarF/ABC1/UbiB family)